MEQVAKVISCSNGIAKVEVKRVSACGENCASCKAGCPTTNIYVDAINQVDAMPNQYVTIESKSKILASAIVLNYVFPLVMFIAGIFLGNRFLPSASMGIKAELYSFLIGIALMTISYIVVVFLDKKFKKANNTIFTVTKIL
jgi:sigma-E factor negative regulatory protein RseC